MIEDQDDIPLLGSPGVPNIPAPEPLEPLVEGLLIPPDEGESVWLLDELVVFKIGLAETTEAISVSEVSAPAGGGPPLHVHHLQPEAFYLLEGTLTLRTGRQTRRVAGGSLVFIPPGVHHAYRVESRTPAKLLLIYAPAGYENFFREVGEVARVKVLPPKDHLPDTSAYVRGQLKFGSEIIGPPLGPG